jgi:hypothetical protein
MGSSGWGDGQYYGSPRRALGESALYSIHVGEEGEGSQVQLLLVLCGSIVAFTALNAATQ